METSRNEDKIVLEHSHFHHDCTVRDVIVSTVAKKTVGSPSSSSTSEGETSSPVTSRDTLQQKLVREFPGGRGGRTKARTLYKRIYRPRRSIRSARKICYKTTVENWRPGGMSIKCPACQSCRIPVVRSHQQHETRSSFCASLLLCCWTFFCLPCCFPQPKREYLHCSTCNAFLAMYDYEENCVEPNFDLFEGGWWTLRATYMLSVKLARHSRTWSIWLSSQVLFCSGLGALILFFSTPQTLVPTVNHSTMKIKVSQTH